MVTLEERRAVVEALAISKPGMVEYEEAAKKLGLKVGTLRVDVYRTRRRLGRTIAKPLPKPSGGAVEKARLDAERAIKALTDLLTQVDGGADKDAVPGLDLKRKVAVDTLKLLGLGAPQTNVQVNIAAVVPSWTAKEWKEVLAALDRDEVAQKELEEFATRHWGWRITKEVRG